MIFFKEKLIGTDTLTDPAAPLTPSGSMHGP